MIASGSARRSPGSSPMRAESGDAHDGLAELLGFARYLRELGVPVGMERMRAFGRAAAALGPRDPADLYWAGRLTLVGRREDLGRYDRAFAAYFGDPPPSEGADEQGMGVEVGPSEGSDAGPTADDGEEAETVTVGAASPSEVLRRKSFEEYTPQEREAAAALITRLGASIPRRRSRRTRPARRGTHPDLGRTLRRSLRTFGEPIDQRYRRRRLKPRRLVLVLDVSGSMGTYARPLAQFAHAAVHAGGAVDAFAFGTRLTRVTPALERRDPDAALALMGEVVPDWESGTRIGDSLRELVHDWGRHGPLRGAVVVVCSDGLERGDPGVLGREMARLGRLAYRVVWVNPLKGSSGYEPLARGMAAALPHIDVFLPGHNLASLEELAALLGGLWS